MKFLTPLFFVFIFITACKNNQNPKVVTVETTAVTKKALDPNATYAKVEFTISGMACAVGCAKKIEKNLAKLEGVKSAKVDFENKLAQIEFDVTKQSNLTLEENVSKTGEIYKVENMKTVDEF